MIQPDRSESPTRLVAALLLLAGLSGCGDGLVDTGPDAGPSNAGATEVCVPGTLDCPCDGERCGLTAGGDALMCREGRCALPRCTPGTAGCACLGGSTCAGDDLDCTGGLCVATDCTPGSLGCACAAGACFSGLACQDGTACVDATGLEGGACLPNGRCEGSNRCDALADLCVHCDPGSAGCRCGAGDGCAPGLSCAAGLCVDAATVPPEDPPCYTPCRTDLVGEEGTRACGPDGLLEGCVAGRACMRGSCVLPGEAPPSCEGDLQCPAFQACVAGGCYSNCEVHADCPSGLGCYRKVCRLPCSAYDGDAHCDEGFSCDAPDGENGYCTPTGAVARQAQALPSGGFSVDVSTLSLSNIATTGRFEVRNEGPSRQAITIRKLRHTIHFDDGRSETVEAPRDPQTGAYRDCDPGAGECPLHWLQLGSGGELSQAPVLEVVARAGCIDDGSCPVVELSGAGDGPGVRWDGELEVCSQDGCRRPSLQLDYVERPDGQWVGRMFYFGSFEDRGLSQWRQGDRGDASAVDNALIKKWAELRRGGLSDGFTEFEAILAATEGESWRFGEVQERCRSERGACYPYSNLSGVRTYSDDLSTTPIPSGKTSFTMAMNLAVDGNGSLVGRIDSEKALQYAGNPELRLDFVADPADPDSCDPAGEVSGDCLVFADSMQARIAVGARYYGDADGCAEGFVERVTPWLIDGFDLGTAVDPQTGRRYRHECRDGLLPLPGDSDLNAEMAGANPVPDGRERVRTLSLLDGALINQRDLFLLFEERFESFVPGEVPGVAYGYMRLSRQPAELSPEDFVGQTPPEVQHEGVPRGVSCEPSILSLTATAPEAQSLDALDDETLGAVVSELISGPTVSSGLLWEAISADWVHVFCEETGLIDGGVGNDGSAYPVLIPCPAWSKVTYFTIDPEVRGAEAIRTLACNALPSTPDADPLPDGEDADGCLDELQAWRDSDIVDIWEPYHTCEDPERIFCDDEARRDLLAGKQFWRRTDDAPSEALPGLLAALDQAFRYKTRFRASSGNQVGFAPKPCVPGSDQVPYCYEAPVIEEIRGRVDCLLEAYTAHSERLSPTVAGELNRFLRQSFSSFVDPVTQEPLHEGFERLYAELLVMLGDEALAAAFGSRFDLAGVQSGPFEGSRFERGGIDLTGVAGREMSNLYRAVQYYQQALDRLYLMGPNFEAALSKAGASTDDEVVFVSPATVTDYLERLTRAATQKARAHSEIAKQYQSFNRPDLARRVLERAYAGTYLESVLLSNLMVDVLKRSPQSSLDQLRLAIADAQLRYRMAMLGMADVYGAVSDTITYFGFEPDYVPFPALDSGNVRDTNAYEVLASVARQKLELAKQRELAALDAGRTGRLDEANFQAELVRVRNTWENQLADICGTFVGDDGQVYPATRKYAPQSEETLLRGDPCGLVGNGQIHEALGQVQLASLSLTSAATRHDNLLREMEIEAERVRQQCELIDENARIQFEHADVVIDMQQEIGEARNEMNARQRETEAITSSIQILAGAEATNLGAAFTGAYLNTLTLLTSSQRLSVKEADILEREKALAEAERDVAKILAENQCDAAEIDSLAKIATLRLSRKEAELEAVRAMYQVRLQLSDASRLANLAQRVHAQQREAESLLIDVEGARNDPNVRLYRNDAIINADVAFDDAMRAVYRATRVFEYYSSQTYPKRDELFLIRMVTAGEYNLENYLLELENTFFEFEELYGVPDTRVQVLSLRDDIMQIPLLDAQGVAYTQGERIDMMRERLRDVRLLDENGYLTLGFSTELRALSPLTRNHKIQLMEVDVVGSNVGDTLGRVYLRSVGTGVIRTVSDEIDYYVFPERTAVIDTFFNGNRVFDPGVYQSFRMRDRPLVNTLWEFVINQRDEEVNQDIDLQSLTDVRLLTYYTDFTAL